MLLDPSPIRCSALARAGRGLLAALMCSSLVQTAPVSLPHGQLRFADVTNASGIAFAHERGAEGRKHLPETMGSGAAWIDFDNDGDNDLYIVQSGALGTTQDAAVGATTQDIGNVLYSNRGDGRFSIVSSGLEHRGYGMGVSAADFDGDGWIDVFVANLGPDALFRNNGDGTYSETHSGIADDDRWSVSSAWGDLDSDGLPDLFVAKYVVYDLDEAPSCGEQQLAMRSYCHIDLYDGEADALYRNVGDGRFVDVAAQAGIAGSLRGKGLGVVMGDVDEDGSTDIVVANDTQQNFFYANRGNWTFEELGLFSGLGYGGDGKAQAGMGVEMADIDGDGAAELLVTNFALESNNLYRPLAPGTYLDDASALGFAGPGVASLSFGIVAFDADGDGDREIAVANGHILDNVEDVQDNTTYAQPNHLFDNLLTDLRRQALRTGALSPELPTGGSAGWRPAGGLFRQVAAATGGGLAAEHVSRGIASGDADGDGRPDLVIVNSGGPARLLRNESDLSNHRMIVRLRGRRSNRAALGARVSVRPAGGDAIVDGAAGFDQVAEVRSASSYCSQNAGDLYFGLASSAAADVEIVWPGGATQRFTSLPADHVVLVFEGSDTPVLRAVTRP